MHLFMSFLRYHPFYNGSNPLALEAFVAEQVDGVRPHPDSRANHLYESTYKEICLMHYQQLPLLKFILKGGLPTTIKSRLEAFRR